MSDASMSEEDCERVFGTKEPTGCVTCGCRLGKDARLAGRDMCFECYCDAGELRVWSAMTIRVYPSSKAKHATWWRALRAANVPIAASWIDWPYNAPGAGEPTPGDWADHWQTIIAEAAAADICLIVCLDGETACGQLIEAGSALAAGKRVFVVSDYQWTFANHPRCRVFATLEDAIAAIMAGERHQHPKNRKTPAAAAGDHQTNGRDRSGANRRP